MTKRWSRQDDSDAAVAAILEGAEKAFGRLGVARSGMNEIADAAGCSRGTIYHHFSNRHELHIAYVKRVAEEIRISVASGPSAGEDIVSLILATLAEVRNRAGAIAWFAPGEVVRMGKSAEIQSILMGRLIVGLDDGPTTTLRQKWFIRLVVSFLTDPGEPCEEEEMLRQFASPGFNHFDKINSCEGAQVQSLEPVR